MKETMKTIAVAIAVAAIPVSCIVRHETSPETQAKRAAEVAQAQAEKMPRKVNEANGCEVWAFKPADRWLYFTRCGAKTETVNTWDVCRSVQQGKASRTVCDPHNMAITQETR